MSTFNMRHAPMTKGPSGVDFRTASYSQTVIAKVHPTRPLREASHRGGPARYPARTAASMPAARNA